MYYKVCNSYGEAYLMSSRNTCVIVSIPFDGPMAITCHNNAFRKQPDDMITESSSEEFQKHATSTFTKITGIKL